MDVFVKKRAAPFCTSWREEREVWLKLWILTGLGTAQSDLKKSHVMVLTSGIQPVSMWIKLSSPIFPHDSGPTLKRCTHTHSTDKIYKYITSIELLSTAVPELEYRFAAVSHINWICLWIRSVLEACCQVSFTHFQVVSTCKKNIFLNWISLSVITKDQLKFSIQPSNSDIYGGFPQKTQRSL